MQISAGLGRRCSRTSHGRATITTSGTTTPPRQRRRARKRALRRRVATPRSSSGIQRQGNGVAGSSRNVRKSAWHGKATHGFCNETQLFHQPRRQRSPPLRYQAAAGGSWIWDQRKPRAARCCQTHAMPASAWNNAKWAWTSAKPDAWLILIATTFSSSQKVFANRATCATYISRATIPEFRSKAEPTMSTNAPMTHLFHQLRRQRLNPQRRQHFHPLRTLHFHRQRRQRFHPQWRQRFHPLRILRFHRLRTQRF